MTNKEVIEALRRTGRPDAECRIWVRVHTRRHSVAEVTPFEVDHAGIWISLPENMHVVERKGVPATTEATDPTSSD